MLGGPADAQTPLSVMLGDGREVGLSGLAWPATRQDVREEASAILSELAGSITLHAVTERRDRYGRALAQVGDDGGGWLQGRLLEQGWRLPASRANRTTGRFVCSRPSGGVVRPRSASGRARCRSSASNI